MAIYLSFYKKIHMKILFLFCFLTSFIHANEINYSLVFIYIGEKLPDYLPITVAQARLFNQKTPIFIITNQSSLNSHPLIKAGLEESNVHFISCEQLDRSEHHKIFNNKFKELNIHNYWKYTTERFFYLDELIREYDLTNVFQIEADVISTLQLFE